MENQRKEQTKIFPPDVKKSEYTDSPVLNFFWLKIFFCYRSRTFFAFFRVHVSYQLSKANHSFYMSG